MTIHARISLIGLRNNLHSSFFIQSVRALVMLEGMISCLFTVDMKTKFKAESVFTSSIWKRSVDCQKNGTLSLAPVNMLQNRETVSSFSLVVGDERECSISGNRGRWEEGEGGEGGRETKGGRAHTVMMSIWGFSSRKYKRNSRSLIDKHYLQWSSYWKSDKRSLSPLPIVRGLTHSFYRDDDLYSYLSRQTSAPDHEIILDGRLLHLALSPDYKYLYATVNMSPRSSSPLVSSLSSSFSL